MTRLRAALVDLRQNPGAHLIIPPGEYILHDDTAYAYQQAVMEGEYGDNPHLKMFNHKSIHVIGLDFTGLENVTIEATGATLFSDGFMETLAIQRCKNVTIHGLTLDMKRRPYTRGVIRQVGDGWFDVEFADEKWVSEKMPIPRMLVMDEQKRLIVKSISAAVESTAVKERVGENTFRLFYPMEPEFTGKVFYALHTWHSRPAILIYEAENVTMSDVRVHCNPGMGVVGHRSRDITLNRLMIVPAIGEMASTNTDATHFVSCQGRLRLEGCCFEGQGDDAINVHGFYQTIQAVEDDWVQLKVMVRCGIHSLRLEHPDVGDTLEWTARENLRVLDTYRVTAVELDEENQQCRVRLDRPLPANAVGEVMVNITQQPSLEFLGCHTRNHLARSMLVRTSNVLIEGCTFERSTINAISISAELFWNESTTSSNVVIRGNRILNCGGQGKDHISGLSVGGIDVYLGAEKNDLQLHRNITVEDNSIDCENIDYAMRFSGVNGLCLRGNETNRPTLIENCTMME